MTRFMVELYISKTDRATATATARILRAAAELTAEGTRVRIVHSIFVPQEEMCFLVVEAATAEAVWQTAARAAIPFDSVVQTEGVPDNTKGAALQ
jgi:hypothetical protein